MNVIIIGYGRVGEGLADLICGTGNNVTVVDNNPQVVANVSPDFPGRVVLGLGYDEDVLVEAGIEECDAFAAVTSSDNVNLMASEVARQLYSVPHVITRLVNPGRLDVYNQLGLDYVCDTEIVAEDIFAKIRSRKAHHIDTFGPYEVMTFALDADGGEVSVGTIEAVGDVRVVLIDHAGETIRPGRDMLVEDGDIIMAVVYGEDFANLERYMRG